MGHPSSFSEPVLAITKTFLHCQAEELLRILAMWEGELWRVGEDHDIMQKKRDMLWQNYDTAVQTAIARVLEVWDLWEHLAKLEAQSVEEAEGQWSLEEGGLTQAEAEVR
ncbi:hypothetical protein C0989_004254, partial [Termitomyces sp. Mn162]